MVTQFVEIFSLYKNLASLTIFLELWPSRTIFFLQWSHIPVVFRLHVIFFYLWSVQIPICIYMSVIECGPFLPCSLHALYFHALFRCHYYRPSDHRSLLLTHLLPLLSERPHQPNERPWATQEPKMTSRKKKHQTQEVISTDLRVRQPIVTTSNHLI